MKLAELKRQLAEDPDGFRAVLRDADRVGALAGSLNNRHGWYQTAPLHDVLISLLAHGDHPQLDVAARRMDAIRIEPAVQLDMDATAIHRVVVRIKPRVLHLVGADDLLPDTLADVQNIALSDCALERVELPEARTVTVSGGAVRWLHAPRAETLVLRECPRLEFRVPALRRLDVTDTDWDLQVDGDLLDRVVVLRCAMRQLAIRSTSLGTLVVNACPNLQQVPTVDDLPALHHVVSDDTPDLEGLRALRPPAVPRPRPPELSVDQQRLLQRLNLLASPSDAESLVQLVHVVETLADPRLTQALAHPIRLNRQGRLSRRKNKGAFDQPAMLELLRLCEGGGVAASLRVAHQLKLEHYGRQGVALQGALLRPFVGLRTLWIRGYRVFRGEFGGVALDQLRVLYLLQPGSTLEWLDQAPQLRMLQLPSGWSGVDFHRFPRLRSVRLEGGDLSALSGHEGLREVMLLQRAPDMEVLDQVPNLERVRVRRDDFEAAEAVLPGRVCTW